MKKEKWKKITGGIMAGLMTFSILGTTMAAPAYASSWSEQRHREEVQNEMQRHRETMNQMRYEEDKHEYERQERVRREQWEREHRHESSYERNREARAREEAQRSHDKKVQQNRTIAAAAIAAIMGAVIAKNS